MAFLRFTRDKRGYEHFYLVQPSQHRGKSIARVLYWFRTPPNVKVGRDPFDESVRRELEAQNPGVEFDWKKIVATPIPSADAEKWRERRRAEKAARASRRAETAEPQAEAETEAEPDVQAEAEAEVETDADVDERTDADESAADSGDAPLHQLEAAAAAASAAGEAQPGDTPDSIARETSNVEVRTEHPAESDESRRRRRRRRRRRGGSGPQNAGGGPPATPGGDV